MGFEREVEVTVEELRFLFWVGWAFTTHSTQGMSIDAPITVHDANCMQRHDPSILYTAITRTTKYEYLNFKETKAQYFNALIYKITLTATGQVYVGSTEARVTKDDTFATALNERWKGHKQAALQQQEAGALYEAMRERGAAAFSGCVLLAHYVLPAPPRSWPLHRQQEAKKAEMAPMEGFWMDKLDARTSGFNKKSEGLCMD